MKRTRMDTYGPKLWILVPLSHLFHGGRRSKTSYIFTSTCFTWKTGVEFLQSDNKSLSFSPYGLKKKKNHRSLTTINNIKQYYGIMVFDLFPH